MTVYGTDYKYHVYWEAGNEDGTREQRKLLFMCDNLDEAKSKYELFLDKEGAYGDSFLLEPKEGFIHEYHVTRYDLGTEDWIYEGKVENFYITSYFDIRELGRSLYWTKEANTLFGEDE